MKNCLAISTLLGVGLLTIGCGGGSGNGSVGSGSSSPPGGTQTTTLGNASITYQGNLRATVAATGQLVTAFGVAGANISAMSFYPTNNLGDTNILYQDKSDIYSYSPRTFATTDISHNAYTGAWPSASANGIVAFTRIDALGYTNIWEMKTDGSNQVQITKGFNFFASVSISPNGSLLSAMDTMGNIYRITNSGVATKIYTSVVGGDFAQFFYGTSWSPDSSRIAYYGVTGIYTISPSGGTPTLVYNGPAYAFPSWSADGSQLVLTNTEAVYVISSAGPPNQTAIPVIGTTTSGICGAAFSPDSKKIAYLQEGSGTTKGIYTCDPNGSNSTYVAAVTNPGLTPVVWTGFLPPENMIGSGGVMNTSSASGVVVTTGTKGFGSLLSFTASTPSSAVVVGSNSTQGPIGFTVTADSITSVTWMNSYFGPPNTKALTSTAQLLFAVDGSTGVVSFVAPAADPKASKISKVAKGSSVVFSGRFSSVLNGQGKNIAPGGATSITVDGASSRLLSAK